jgi:cell division transport system permease protein
MSDGPVMARAVSRGLAGLQGLRGAQLLPQARLAGPIAWVIAIMIALMTVAACGGLALKNMASGTRAELSGGLTVQIVDASYAERERQATAVLQALRGQPGVTQARRVPDEELAALIEPWLGGEAASSSAIPIPALIDARLDGPVSPDRLTDLRSRIANIAPAARIEAQSAWLAPVFSAITSLQWLALSLILLLSLVTGAAIWLAARTALGSNRETIEVVHHLGGTDAQIARIFQNSVAFEATLGACSGLLLGLAAAKLIGGRFLALESGMVAGAGLGWLDWLLVALLPVAGVLLAMLTARLTVMAALRRML